MLIDWCYQQTYIKACVCLTQFGRSFILNFRFDLCVTPHIYLAAN